MLECWAPQGIRRCSALLSAFVELIATRRARLSRPAGRHLNTAPGDDDDVEDGCFSGGTPVMYVLPLRAHNCSNQESYHDLQVNTVVINLNALFTFRCRER
jgi:hypothetical protein